MVPMIYDMFFFLFFGFNETFLFSGEVGGKGDLYKYHKYQLNYTFIRLLRK